MKRLVNGHNQFSKTQTVTADVTVYDTPFTTVSKGIYYRPAYALPSFAGSFAATYAQLEEHFNEHTVPGLHDDTHEVFGRIPLIHDYWGTGAPLGVNASNRAALRYTGYVKTPGTQTLALLGQGSIVVYVNGAQLAAGNITPNDPLLTLPYNYQFGDRVDIFFWAVNVSWGGLSIRLLGENTEPDWEYIREQPVLSASWMDSAEPVQEHLISRLTSVTVQVREGNVTSATVELPITSSDEVLGWHYDPALVQAIHNSTQFTIKKGHRISIDGGVGATFREFTGFVDDIIPTKRGITIQCQGFESRLTQTLSENFPDNLSYASYGYTETEGVSEPVYGVPAYDHWPYEHAVKDLLYRAWIDPEYLTARKRIGMLTETGYEETLGSPLIYCRGPKGEHIRVPRQVRYGNASGSPNMPDDDPYLYPSELTETIYQRIVALAQKIGYRFETNSYGEFVFRPKNNPVTPTHLITSETPKVSPGAIGGTYVEYTGAGWAYESPDLYGSRLELVVGRTDDSGKIRVEVTNTLTDDSVSAVYDLASSETLFYYDNVLTTDGQNSCAITVLTGGEYAPYKLRITPEEPIAESRYLLNAIRIYEADPLQPASIFNLRTFDNLIEINAKSNSLSRLNDALVIGQRQHTLTDSAKADGAQEHIFSRATDIHSILNPDAPNYLGYRVTAFLSDETIASKDLADWTSRTLISQYRLPKPDAQIRHTALPALEVGDPIFVRDNSLDTFDGRTVMYVTSYQTTYTFGNNPSAITTAEATVFPPPPSYEPVQEIDISLYGNKPVINLNISYPTLAGTEIQNPGPNLPQPAVRVNELTTLQGAPGAFYADIAPRVWSPGSELVQIGQGAWKNFPYYTYYRRTSPTRLDFPAHGGDSSSQYRNPFNATAGQTVNIAYHEILNPYVENPFYDPYMSELEQPKLIDITFDTLVSGFYRVSIVDARSSDRTVVAWLTASGEPDDTGDNQWVYIPPGTGRNFRWDGVDTVGKWNRKQTEDLLSTLRGAFPEKGERYEIGAGYYAHNDQTTPITHISGELQDGEVVYPVGKYAQFFIRIECKRTTDDIPMVVESNRGEDLYNSAAQQLTPRFIYYHLPPQANAVNIQIQDWNHLTGGDFTPGENHWTTVDDSATFRDTKPIRISLTAVPRKGVAFAGDTRHTHVKVNRVVHLTAVCMDSSIVYDGASWNSQSTAERKTVLNRRTVNDEHTLVYADANYTSGDKLTDWIYYPSKFEQDFGRGKEKLRYLDYLQLFEVPHWNPSRFIGEKRSRFLLGYLAYLFYFSVFTQDRSGRLVWAIDPTHIDRSKILTNNETVKQPFDHNRHQRRVIYTRQWWDTDLLNTVLNKWNIPDTRKGFYLDRLNPFDTGNTALYPRNTGSAITGNTLTGYSDFHSEQLKQGGYLPNAWNANRALGTPFVSALGNWTWENDYLWIPSPSRDFHPYYTIPPMGTAEGDLHNHSFGGRVNYWSHKHVYNVTLARYAGGSDGLKRMLPTRAPVDPAVNDIWFSSVRAHNALDTSHDFFRFMLPGVTPLGWFVDRNNLPLNISEEYADYQRIDEFPRYEDSRGSLTNGQAEAYNVISVNTSDPYYVNPVRYRHFKYGYPNMSTAVLLTLRRHIYHASVDQRGLFQLHFRHTYVWESPSHFPTVTAGGIHRRLDSSYIDYDLTQRAGRPTAYDAGAWVGWKDDHPSAMQIGSFNELGGCTTIHWRDDVNRLAGGSCAVDNPSVAHQDIDGEVTENHNRPTYTTNQNIFLANVPVFAVGPRLPQTRRVLFGLTLVNERRAQPL